MTFQVFLMRKHLYDMFLRWVTTVQGWIHGFYTSALSYFPDVRTWYYVMGGHFTRLDWRVQSSQGSLGKSSNMFSIQWTQRIGFGGRIRSKEPTLISCPDISKWDIPWIRWGKCLGARPLSLKIINRHILLGFVLQIDAIKAWTKSIFGCPHMINGTDLERSPP